MTASSFKKEYSEFPPRSDRWRFSKKSVVYVQISLPKAIALARAELHKDGYSLTQQDSILAIATKHCVLRGKFTTVRKNDKTCDDVWQIRYEYGVNELCYPPYGIWRTKYGKFPELPQ